jgi:hypothetical protein
MREREPQGQSIRVDPLAESSNPSLPAFIAVPKGAPAYHGFPLLPHSEKEGFSFGVITEPNGEAPASWGDAFVVAPDGSRAGIVWQAEGEPSPVVCSPSPGRWGVYAFRFRRPVRNEQDLIENLHEVLPQLKAFYAAALVEHPESTNANLRAESTHSSTTVPSMTDQTAQHYLRIYRLSYRWRRTARRGQAQRL